MHAYAVRSWGGVTIRLVPGVKPAAPILLKNKLASMAVAFINNTMLSRWLNAAPCDLTRPHQPQLPALHDLRAYGRLA